MVFTDAVARRRRYNNLVEHDTTPINKKKVQLRSLNFGSQFRISRYVIKAAVSLIIRRASSLVPLNYNSFLSGADVPNILHRCNEYYFNGSDNSVMLRAFYNLEGILFGM